MAQSQVTFNDKVENGGITDEGKIRGTDINELKSTINDNATDVEARLTAGNFQYDRRTTTGTLTTGKFILEGVTSHTLPASPLDGAVVELLILDTVNTQTLLPNAGQTLADGSVLFNEAYKVKAEIIYKLSTTTWEINAWQA